MSQTKKSVVFEPEVLADIFLYAKLCPVEISGLAKVRRKNNRFVVYGEPIIFEQTCNLIHTGFDSRAHHLWLDQSVREGRINDIRECRLWWHSHVWADTYFSRTDNRTIKYVFGGGLDKWWLFLVVNKLMEASLRLDIFRPHRMPPVFFKSFDFSRPISFEDLLSIMKKREGSVKQTVLEKVKVVEIKSKENN